MQNRLNVDVHARALRAAERVGARIETPTLSQPWWHKYFRWEKNLTLANGRTIEKGWVVPQPLGVALLVIIIGGVGSLYWRVTDKVADMDEKQRVEMQAQREILIRLDQKLTDKNAHDAEFKSKLIDDQKLQDMQIQDLKDRLLVQNGRRK